MIFLVAESVQKMLQKLLGLVSSLYHAIINCRTPKDEFGTISGLFPFGALWFFKSYKSPKDVLTFFSQFLSGMAKIFENEDAFEVQLGFRRMVVLTSPEAIKELLTSKTEIKKNFLYDTFKLFIGEGLITTSDAKAWKFHRKTINPNFSQKMLERYQSTMSEKSQQLCDQLALRADGRPFAMCTYIVKIVFSNILESATSTTADDDQKDQWFQMIERVTQIFVERLLKINYTFDKIFYSSSLGKEALTIVQKLDRSVEPIFKERQSFVISKLSKSQNEWNANVDRPCLFDSLIEHQMTNNGVQSFTDKEIMDEGITMVAAGYDTTGSGLDWFFLLVGNHPEVQFKIHQELNDIFGMENGREITQSDVTQMKYLTCVVKEVLRLHSPVGLIFRQLIQDLVIDGRRIPAGTDVAVYISSVHRHPKYFENPDHFLPERFLPENASKIHPYAYIPFSAGPRNCVGFTYAMKFMVTATAAILRRFTVEAVETRDKYGVIDMTTTKPTKPILVKLYERRFN